MTELRRNFLEVMGIKDGVMKEGNYHRLFEELGMPTDFGKKGFPVRLS